MVGVSRTVKSVFSFVVQALPITKFSSDPVKCEMISKQTNYWADFDEIFWTKPYSITW